MNRDFEKEYIELAQCEIPDLWDRIEAGLTEKSAPETEKTNKTKKRIYWKRYTGLAAAVLCAAVVIPAVVLTGQTGKSSAADTSAQTGACEIAEEACETAEEACEPAEEVYDAEAGYAETADTASEGAFDTAAAPDMEDSAGGDVSDDITGSGTERHNENESAKVEAASGAMVNMAESIEEKRRMQVLSNLIVQVAGTEDSGEKQEGSSLGGMLYTVIVSQDPSGTFSEGEQIEVYAPGDLSAVISMGKEVEIDLICEENGEYPFVIEKIYVE